MRFVAFVTGGKTGVLGERTGLSVVMIDCCSVCAVKAELIVSAVTVLAHTSSTISLLAMQLGVSDLILLSERVIGLCEIGICLVGGFSAWFQSCLLYTSPSPRDGLLSRMPSSA